MTHPDLEAALARINVTVDASEAHGWLTGGLCARPGYGAGDWLADMAAAPGAAEVDPSLLEMTARVRAALGSDDFEFAPLLPGDEEPLDERVAALASWAAGFLYGVGTGGADPQVARSGEVGEFLRDLAEIARAELEPGRAAEAGEADFTELFEFVRAGVQLTFYELSSAATDARG